MPLQLELYIAANGNELNFGRKRFTVEGITSEGDGPDDTALATVKAVRASYNAIRCNKSRVSGKPGAEVWAVMASNGRDIARFAVHDGRLHLLG